MVTSVSSVSSSISVKKGTTSTSSTAAKSASSPVVNISALAKLFQAQVPTKTLDEALKIDVTNKASLKVPFTLNLNQSITSLNSNSIEKLNKLIDVGVIASVKPAVDPNVIKVSFTQMQGLTKLLPKLAPPSTFTLTADRISGAQAVSLTTDLMKKLAYPVIVADDPLNLSQGDVWTKLGQMANSGALKALQLTGTSSSELQLTYSQFKAGANVLSKIGASYQVSVRDVTAANANSVAALANVRRVNIRDSIDSIMFLGSNIQKISSEQKLGTITSTSAPIDVAQPLSYFKSHLGVIGSLADADKLNSLRLTDLPSGTLALSSVEIARNAKALGILLNNPGPFVLDNSGTVSAQQAKDITTLLQGHTNVSLLRPLQISDTASALLSASDSLFGTDAPSISSIKIVGDVKTEQAVLFEDLGSAFSKFEAFRIVDTAEQALALDLSPPAHTALNSKISGIRVTSALDVGQLSTIYPTSNNQGPVIEPGKGNVLAKLLAGLEISGTPSAMSDQITRLAKLASDGKLRSINATVPADFSIASVTDFQKSLRDNNLSDYPLSLSIADSIGSLISSDATEQLAISTHLKTLDSTGLLKSIYAADQGAVAELTISQASSLAATLDSIGLGNKLLPMKVVATGTDFGTATEPPVTKQRPYFFPNLGNLSALAGMGRLIMPPTIDLSDLDSDPTNQTDLRTQLVNLGLMLP